MGVANGGQNAEDSADAFSDAALRRVDNATDFPKFPPSPP